MTKKRGCLIAAVLGVAALGLACYGVVRSLCEFELEFGSPYLFVSVCPETRHEAHFLTEGFQERCVSLFVRPGDESSSEPMCVAELAWSANRFDGAAWSGDGSVIACRANVEIRDNTTDERNKIYSGKFYSVAYDFRERKAIVWNGPGEASRGEWEAHSHTIDTLLKSRGGLGEGVTSNEIRARNKKLDWGEWQVYRKAMRRRRP